MRIIKRIVRLLKKIGLTLRHPVFIHSFFGERMQILPEDLVIQRYFEGIADGILVDVGAHIGKYTTQFAEKGWRCFSFEPEKKNFSKLGESTQPYGKVSIYNMAVSNCQDDEIDFYVSSEHWGAHSIKPWHSTHLSSYKVKCIRLDKFCQQQAIKRITFLKIDTEGNDFYVVKSMDFKSIKPDLILTEFSSKRTTSHFDYHYEDMARYLAGYGYKGFMFGLKEVKLFAREGEASAPIKFQEFCHLGEEKRNRSNDGNIIFYQEGNEKFEEVIGWFLEEHAKKYLNKWLD